MKLFSRARRAELESDPDISAEASDLAELSLSGGANAPPAAAAEPAPPAASLRLSVISGSHRATDATRRLLQEAGGIDVLRRFTTLFYERSFVDPKIDKFIRDPTYRKPTRPAPHRTAQPHSPLEEGRRGPNSYPNPCRKSQVV